MHIITVIVSHRYSGLRVVLRCSMADGRYDPATLPEVNGTEQ